MKNTTNSLQLSKFYYNGKPLKISSPIAARPYSPNELYSGKVWKGSDGKWYINLDCNNYLLALPPQRSNFTPGGCWEVVDDVYNIIKNVIEERPFAEEEAKEFLKYSGEE